MLIYTGVAFICFSLLLIYYKNLNQKRKESSIPVDWPIFGTTPGLLRNIDRLHDYMTEILQQSGGTILLKGPCFTNLDLMLTSDPANVNYVLSKNFKNFQKGNDFKKIFDILGNGIFVAESDSWERQRKTAMLLIKDASFQKFAVEVNWEKMEGGLLPILDHFSKIGTEVDLQDIFQRFAFDCVCIQVLGHDPVSLCPDLPYVPFEKAFVDAEEAIFQRHLLPETVWKLLKWLGIGKERKMNRSMEFAFQYMPYLISLKSMSPNKTTNKEDIDLLTSYMKLIAENSPHSTEAWRDNMLNFIVAGKDTISASLSWFFWLIATHPEEEIKIRQEIVTNLQVDEDGKWSFSNVDELKNLTYLHGALCEALRLYPPVAIQHKAPVESDELPSGHRVRAKTKTLLLFYAMGRMESIWGKDCLEFKPERWISAPGHIKTVPSFMFPAFNAGPRSCLGKDMSFVQMKLVAAAIISRYQIRVVEGHPVCPNSSVILHMKHGLKVKLSNHLL